MTSEYDRLRQEAADKRQEADDLEAEARGVQVTRTDLEGMTHKEINQARREGRLDDIRKGQSA